jgi:hypothetical protein
LCHQPLVQVEEVLHVGGGVLALAVAQGPPEPVGQTVTLGWRDPDLALQQRHQRRGAVADEAGRQLGVEHLRRYRTDRMGEHVEILLCGVDHTQRIGREQLLERCDVDRERVDQGEFLPVGAAPSHLDERELRKVRALAVELGVEGIAGRGEQCLDEVVEIALSVDPARDDASVSHRPHRTRRR